MMVHFETYFESEYIDETVFLPNDYTEEEIQRQADAWLIERLGASFEVLNPKAYSIKNLFSRADISPYNYTVNVEFGETKYYYYRMGEHKYNAGRCAIALIRKDLEGTDTVYFKTREDAENWITKESEEL